MPRRQYAIPRLPSELIVAPQAEVQPLLDALDPERVAACCYGITDADGVYSFCAFNNLYRFPGRTAAVRRGA